MDHETPREYDDGRGGLPVALEVAWQQLPTMRVGSGSGSSYMTRVRLGTRRYIGKEGRGSGVAVTGRGYMAEVRPRCGGALVDGGRRARVHRGFGQRGCTVVGIAAGKEWARWHRKRCSDSGRGEPTGRSGQGYRDTASAENHGRARW
jgi:hypothetical protein